MLNYNVPHLLAKHCGLESHEFIHHLGKYHIYDDHIDALTKQVVRNPYKFPMLTISSKKENINDYEVNDFIVENYNFHAPIKMEMRK